MNKFVLLAGDPISGVTLIGPFDSFEDAEEYAQILSDNWWITDLEAPVENVEMWKGER